jgi:hypothetical protein
MPRSGTGKFVQLYDVTRSRIVRSLTPDELNRMAANGNVGWFLRKGKTCACLQPIPMQSRTSDPIHSKIPLMQTDMEMNAEGVCDGSRKFGLNRFGQVDDSIIGNRVDQSMSKVEAWPEVFDAKNVTICAGEVHGITEMTTEQLAAL